MNTINNIDIVNRDGITYSFVLLNQESNTYKYKLKLNAWSNYIEKEFNNDIIVSITPPGGPSFVVDNKYSEVFDMVLSKIELIDNQYILTFIK